MLHPGNDKWSEIECIYKGETADRLPDGLGYFYWEGQNKKIGRGFGTFKEGKLNGRALIFDDHGNRMS